MNNPTREYLSGKVRRSCRDGNGSITAKLTGNGSAETEREVDAMEVGFSKQVTNDKYDQNDNQISRMTLVCCFLVALLVFLIIFPVLSFLVQFLVLIFLIYEFS